MGIKNMVGVEELAKIIHLSPGTIKNYCAEGKIKAKKIGKTWVVDKNDIWEEKNDELRME